jgi:hypothetical protein
LTGNGGRNLYPFNAMGSGWFSEQMSGYDIFKVILSPELFHSAKYHMHTDAVESFGYRLQAASSALAPHNSEINKNIRELSLFVS